MAVTAVNRSGFGSPPIGLTAGSFPDIVGPSPRRSTNHRDPVDRYTLPDGANDVPGKLPAVVQLRTARSGSVHGRDRHLKRTVENIRRAGDAG